MTELERLDQDNKRLREIVRKMDERAAEVISRMASTKAQWDPVSWKVIETWMTMLNQSLRF